MITVLSAAEVLNRAGSTSDMHTAAVALIAVGSASRCGCSSSNAHASSVARDRSMKRHARTRMQLPQPATTMWNANTPVPRLNHSLLNSKMHMHT
jgi:hypothetical protein